MAHVAYVNGRFVPRSEAMVSVDDRGLVFADSVYEVILVAGGRLIDLDGHLARLRRSLDALRFERAPETEAVTGIVRALVRENAVDDGMVYIQVGRGTAPRDLSPADDLAPSMIATTRPHVIRETLDPARAIAVATLPDQRWGRCDIKTTALVAGVMARLDARARGCDDAWLVSRDGFVTEGCASNAWIVRGETLVTRPSGPEILSGITRDRLMRIAGGLGLRVVEEKFDVATCQRADEAFQSSATALVTPVRTIDGVTIGAGAPGPITTRIYDAYLSFIRVPFED